MTTETQCTQILQHMRDGYGITPLEALGEYGCFRLGARIYDLRQEGHNIYRVMVLDERTGKRFARYSLLGSKEAGNG